MKTIIKLTVILCTTIILFSCNNNDDDTPQNPILGIWEVVDGTLVDFDKYVYFNTDNTVNILGETPDNFKIIFNTNYSVSSDKITIDGLAQGGPAIFNYHLNGDNLTLRDRGVILKRIDNATSPSSWLQELNILSEGDAPWEGDVDIAFTYDKTKIVYGKTNDSDHIGLIDPNTFEEVGQIATSNSAKAVEIEKYNEPERYRFESNNGSEKFYGYDVSNNSLELIATTPGAWITGLASVDYKKIWAASNNESSLYLYNYDTENIDQTITLEIQPQGLDYQNGFLFICDGRFVHKTQVSPTFKVLKSYKIIGTSISGIAFDGNNFWVSGYKDGKYKIIKTSLVL